MSAEQQRIFELIALFHKPRILVLGDLMLDEWIWGKVSRVSPEAPVPVVEVIKRTYTPGGASNVAANLRSLGAFTVVGGLVGEDDSGKILKRELRKFGVDLSAVLSVKNRPTTVKTRIIAHNQQVVRADVEVRDSIDGRYEKKVLDLCGPVLRKADALLFSDYNKGFIRSSFISSLVHQGIQGKKVVVAGAKPANLSLFHGVTLVVLNESEAEQAVGWDIGNDQDLERAGFLLRDRMKTRGVLITRGEHGMALFENGKKMLLIPARASEVYDVSGAGDTVIAVITLALTAGASMHEAALIANHGAGVVVKKVGTATVGCKELKESFKDLKEILRFARDNST